MDDWVRSEVRRIRFGERDSDRYRLPGFSEIDRVEVLALDEEKIVTGRDLARYARARRARQQTGGITILVTGDPR